MPTLTAPTTGLHASFVAGLAEFQAEGRGTADDHTALGTEIRSYGDRWATADGFADYVAWMLAQPLEDTPRPAGFVPATTLWWADGTEYLGRVGIRHRLNENLLQVGGHIGYDVRPSARRRGHATAMLRAVLPVAATLGITSALLTCDVANIASRTVIERNGGVLEDCRDGKLRFWVPTAR